MILTTSSPRSGQHKSFYDFELKLRNSFIYSSKVYPVCACIHYTGHWRKYPHLLLSSSILSVGIIMFPYSSMFWKDWKVFTCCGISSRQAYSNNEQRQHAHIYLYACKHLHFTVYKEPEKPVFAKISNIVSQYILKLEMITLSSSCFSLASSAARPWS